MSLTEGTLVEYGVEVELIWCDSYVLELRLRLRSASFGATVDVYVTEAEVLEIASNLQGFPRTPADTRQVEIGRFGAEWAGGGASLRFFCADLSGHSFVDGTIESGEARAGVVESCRILVPIEGAAVDKFVQELRSIPDQSRVWRGGSTSAKARLYPRLPSTEELLREDQSR